MCFCPTPLAHERQTQYDFYSTDMITEEAEEYGEIQGVSLWPYIASKAEAAKRAEPGAADVTMDVNPRLDDDGR
jgi:hypothetical protein